MDVIAEMLLYDPGRDQARQAGEEALSAADSCSVPSSFLRDAGVNTDPDWEEQIRTLLESGVRLQEDYNKAQVELQQDELDFNKKSGDMRKKRDQALKQQQALQEKLESVRVKLQLNNSKATRKTFMSKIQEATRQKNHAQEEKDRLSEELCEAEARLSTLQQEQEEEKKPWEIDLRELREQTERAQNEAKEAEKNAEREMRNALERHMETSEEMFQTWINQVGVYLTGLRVELPHRFCHEKPQWDRRKVKVRKSQAELQTRISELLQQLERHQLDTLPHIHLPALPQVPMAELYFHRIMTAMSRPPAPPPVHGPMLVMGAPPAGAPPPAIVNPRPVLLPHPHPQHFPPYPRQHFPPQSAFMMAPPRMHAPPPLQQHAPPLLQQAPPLPQQPTPPPQHATPPPQQATPPPPAPSPVQQAPPPAPAVNPGEPESKAAPPAVPPPAVSPAPPAASPAPPPPPAPSSSSGAAGKLEMVLEKLGAHFPRCSRTQLTWFLQQVKTERGTLAGLSMEEVVEAIRQKAEASRAPEAAAPPPAPAHQRKPCLMCQKAVEPSQRFELQCSHTVHKECIQVWLQSSKSNNCPFRPNK